MKCPTDQIDLVMTERQGIEIDYCPTCRGIWLDRGELDKLIERAAPIAAAPEPRREERRHEDRPRREDDRYRDRTDLKHGAGKPYKKRESFLSDIFDF